MAGGGGTSDRGGVFSINTDGTGFDLLHSFTGGASDWQYPTGSLTLSGAKLYGMTGVFGSGEGGSIFSMNTDGTGFGLVASFGGEFFDRTSDLTLSGDASTLYGMTRYGGTTYSLGTVFSLPTPEPTSATLLAFGTLLLTTRRRMT